MNPPKKTSSLDAASWQRTTEREKSDLHCARQGARFASAFVAAIRAPPAGYNTAHPQCNAGMEIVYAFCIALGAAVGSFVALVFDRVRRRESIVTPRSHCDACTTSLRAWDNVPIVSWLVLRGRCRFCKAFIPLHTFALEVAGAVAGWYYASEHFH